MGRLRVIVRDKSSDSAHYFCFPAERGRTKLDDVEPLQRSDYPVRGKDITIMLSRLHYIGLVIWIGPKAHVKDQEARPLCRFAWSVHTPCIDVEKTDSSIWDRNDIADADAADGFQRAGWWFTERLFSLIYMLTNSSEIKEYPNVYQELEGVGFDSNQLFNRKSIVNQTRYVLLVGPSPNLDAVKQLLKSRPGPITKGDLDQFLVRLGIP